MPDNVRITPEGVCADGIEVELEGDRITGVVFDGGCSGNGVALGRLLKGMSVDEAINRLHGVDCDGKGTSCADQLARGLREWSENGRR